MYKIKRFSKSEEDKLNRWDEYRKRNLGTNSSKHNEMFRKGFKGELSNKDAFKYPMGFGAAIGGLNGIVYGKSNSVKDKLINSAIGAG